MAIAGFRPSADGLEPVVARAASLLLRTLRFRHQQMNLLVASTTGKLPFSRSLSLVRILLHKITAIFQAAIYNTISDYSVAGASSAGFSSIALVSVTT